MRRAVRYGYTFLGMKEAFMYRLIDTLIESMGDAYPELPAQADLIKHVTKEEEESFLRTLDTGMRMIDNVMSEAKRLGKTEIEGEKAFVLYDTYGFPLDLTELILRENGMTVNIDGFNAEMKKQKERARNAAAVETGDWVELHEGVTEFVGYDMTECDTEILRYRKVKQKNNEYYQIVLARTPFYAEMGGQVGDKGYLQSGDEKIEITDTKRENNLPVHIAKRLPSDVTEGVRAVIDLKARRAIASNHTATHLLHAALRQVLGTHVEQKGSYVDSKMLRFDFSHFKKMTPEEIREVEHVANAMVRRATVREEYRDLPIQQARDMGAMALFGEKYGDKVRVIKYDDSIELCGGTHVDNTGNIGMIKIISESSIAAGIRRIEAISGEEVENMLDHMQDMIYEIKTMFNNAPDAMMAVKKSIAENSSLQKRLDDFIKDKIKAAKDTVLSHAEEVGNIKIAKMCCPMMSDVVKGVAFAIKAQCPENTIFLAATQDNDKPMLTVLITEDLVKQGLNAGTIVREAAKLIQGGGGGQPHFAQAGGRNCDGLAAALDKMRAMLNI